MVKANKSKNNVKNLKTVSINNLSHFYGKNENKKQVLNDFILNIDKGELVLLKGPSGCGKTTLLTLFFDLLVLTIYLQFFKKFRQDQRQLIYASQQRRNPYT